MIQNPVFAIRVKRGLLFAACLLTVAFPLSTCTAAPTVTQVSTGEYHTIFVKSDGSLWGMGENIDGQLGLGADLNQTNLPQQIISSNVSAIAAGAFHSLILESNGTLWGTGDNGYGQLGDGTSGDTRYLPEEIRSNEVTGIVAGGYHSLFTTLIPGSRFVLPTFGFWTMGWNEYGQLGDGTDTDKDSPEELQSTELLDDIVTAMAGGSLYSLHVEENGSLWATGYNQDGELGDGSAYGYASRHFPVQIVPLVIPRPAITNISVVANANLVLSGTNGESGRNYFTLMSTNLALPLNQWTPVATNFVTTDPAFTITATNAVNPNAAQAFYVLQAQAAN